MNSFLTGIVAGYGIAIPVGAIAVLILETGLRRGFPSAFAAGAGAATADFLYAGLAALGGAGLGELVDVANRGLRIASAAVLIAIAAAGLRRAMSNSVETGVVTANSHSAVTTYLRFVGLTIINPSTIVYFIAVIVGLGLADNLTLAQGSLFALGAFLASLSWQTVLAGLGSFAGRRIGEGTRRIAMVIGNLVILVFALVILFS